MRRVLIAVALTVLGATVSQAQTTTYTQTGPGTNCTLAGCINMPLSPTKELLTWADTNSIQKFSFRGFNYFVTAKRVTNPDGSISVNLDSAAFENNGFTVSTLFDSDCFRCAEAWDVGGGITFPTEYDASDTFLYGWNGSRNITSGNGQVGFGVAQTTDSTVALLSSRPDLLQVPASVIIPQNQFHAEFTVTSTPPTATTNSQLAPIPVTVTATFPDNTVATMTVTVGPLPAPPPPPDSMLTYPCGIKHLPCPGTAQTQHKAGTCWWDGKGADWKNIQCAIRSDGITLSDKLSVAKME